VTDASRLLDGLVSRNLSIIVLSEGKELYTSTLPGVRPLLELVDRFPEGLAGATVADRLVGSCAARVFVYLRVTRVLGFKGSRVAEQILTGAGTEFHFGTLIPEVMNRSGTGLCPFEQLSREHPDPEQLLEAIRAKLSGR